MEAYIIGSVARGDFNDASDFQNFSKKEIPLL